MNTIRNISAVLLLSSLALTAPPAGAAFGFIIEADRVNVEGSTFAFGPSVASHFCYLTRVGVENTDSSGETATCHVSPSDGSQDAIWLLEANLSRSDDADAHCSATCQLQ
jgi:hypothetical protein